MGNRNYAACLMLVKRYLCRIACTLGTLIIFIGIVDVFNYLFIDDHNSFSRILWHDFYECKGEIDNVYIGTSHVYSGINPILLDEINGQYNFDLASESQRLNGAYYLLKEADRNNNISNVYLDLYYMFNTKENFNSYTDAIDTEINANWRNIDYMKSSFNRLQYMLSITGPDRYIATLFPFTRYRIKLGNWDRIDSMIEVKSKNDYREYKKIENSIIAYIKQGYCYSTNLWQDKDKIKEQDRILEENPLGEISEKYLRKIIVYCNKRNINITLLVIPMSELRLISTGNYDNYINQVRKIADEYGVEFYDFNLAKEEYLPIHQDIYYRDGQHLNGDGSDLFSTFLSEVISREPSENEKFFYTSYEEKLKSIEPSVYGLIYRASDVSGEALEQVITYWVASNREEDMEYKITLTPEEGEQYVVQNFSENKEFTLAVSEHGICTIEARMPDNPEDIQTLEIEY